MRYALIVAALCAAAAGAAAAADDAKGYPGRPARMLVPHAPGGSTDIMARNADIAAALQVPAIKDRLTTLGFDFTPNSPDQFSDYLRREVAKWGQVVKDSGARVD